MAISIDRANQHVTEWKTKLSRFPSRLGWVSSLYHACQIETAAAIIRQGQLICRRHQPAIICDVANQGALWNNPAAHEFVRLYFRPKNRFHFKTEGIKSTIDPYRVDPHMAIPIMLVFDFKSLMAEPNSYFVAGNFASQALQPQQGDNNFNNLNFDYIYHDSPVTPDMKQLIQDARMAEVVVRDTINLDQHLKAVVCRTIHEERMLRHLIQGTNVSNIRFLVEKSGSLFFRRGIYISELYTNQGTLHFEFAAPSTAQKTHYSVRVGCGACSFSFNLEPKRWRVPQIANADPNAEWRIEIEECLAFFGPVPASSPIVA